MSIPKEVGRLSNLQTLIPINVENTGSGGGGGCGIEVLEGLNLLSGEININNLRNVRSEIDAQRANLKGKKNLHRIFLSWHVWIWNARDSGRGEDGREYDKDEVVLEALQPHPNLKMLVIHQYLGAKLSWWMSEPSCLPNLVVLQLKRCTKCEQIVGFGKLPSLKVLNLYDMVSLEEWVDIPTPTPTPTRFPWLEKICIKFCPNLRFTPTRFPSLKELYLQEINERVAVPLITTNLNSLYSIQLKKISELRYLPHGLLQGNNLRELKVFECPDFQGFLRNEEEEEDGFTSLKVLWLLGLPALKFLPDIHKFTSLEELIIQNCKSFKPIPEDLTCLSSSLDHLKWVHILNVKETKDLEWKK